MALELHKENAARVLRFPEFYNVIPMDILQIGG